MDPDPYEPPEHDSESVVVSGFIPKSDWQIKSIFLLPTALFIAGSFLLKIILQINDLRLGKIDTLTTWIIFAALALPASIYTANYFRRRDQNSLATMIVMVFMHFVFHAFTAFGAAIVLVFFS